LTHIVFVSSSHLLPFLWHSQLSKARVEVSDALFFLGVLFAVGALEKVGALEA